MKIYMILRTICELDFILENDKDLFIRVLSLLLIITNDYNEIVDRYKEYI